MAENSPYKCICASFIHTCVLLQNIFTHLVLPFFAKEVKHRFQLYTGSWQHGAGALSRRLVYFYPGHSSASVISTCKHRQPLSLANQLARNHLFAKNRETNDTNCKEPTGVTILHVGRATMFAVSRGKCLLWEGRLCLLYE